MIDKIKIENLSIFNSENDILVDNNKFKHSR